MPVPRRFDRSLPERDSTRINERIRVSEVRLIGSDGEQVGIVKTSEALRYAQQRELDLVEVAPQAKPPVCRVLDYSKYKYEQAQRQKAARKHQQQITVREIKFRPKIAQHDYDTKKGHVERFLKAKDKVKVTIMFRGREVAHPERGELILNRLAEELEELATVDQRPIVDGRNMTMLLAPLKGKDESDLTAPTKATAGKDSRRTRRNEADAEETPARDAEPEEAEAEEAAAQAAGPSPEPEPEPVVAEAESEVEAELPAAEPEPAPKAKPAKPAASPAKPAASEAKAAKPAAKRKPAAKDKAAPKRAAAKPAASKAKAAKPAEAKPAAKRKPAAKKTPAAS